MECVLSFKNIFYDEVDTYRLNWYDWEIKFSPMHPKPKPSHILYNRSYTSFAPTYLSI
jgi:hypothetical protein